MIALNAEGANLRLQIDDPEATVLRDLAGQLDTMLAARAASTARGSTLFAPDDPALVRLLPDAFRDDPAATREFRALSEPSLIEHKRRNLATVLAGIDSPGVLDSDAQRAWLQVLTDLRLTIASRLGIDTNSDADNEGKAAQHTSSERVPALAEVFEWLAGVQSRLLHVLAERDS